MIYLLIVVIGGLYIYINYREKKRYDAVRPADEVRTKKISVPFDQWRKLGGSFWMLKEHLVKCEDGSIMLPDISQSRYTLGEIRFAPAYETNGVVKGRPVSTVILYKIFGTIPALLNMNRSKKIEISKEELPTYMYLQLFKEDGSYFWLTLSGVKQNDYNEVYMYFR